MDNVTLADVARLSGVSLSTASRVINEQAGVRPDVRERVQRIADHVGFRPNRAARQLASGRSSVIGLVIPTQDLHIDPYGASMTHAVGRAAAARDLGLMLHLAGDEPGTTVHHILRDGLIDGLIVSSVATGRAWIDELLESSLPTVLVGEHPSRPEVYGIDVENTESSARAVAHLFDQGCARVGTVTGPLERADARHRLEGYRLAHERAGRTVDEDLVVLGEFDPHSGSVGAATLLERGVDGIFAANDQMAIGALWACAGLGVKVPDDVAVVGFDGTSTAMNSLGGLSLTSVAQPFDEIARRAIDALLDLVNGIPLTQSVAVVPTLVEGGSSLRRAAP